MKVFYRCSHLQNLQMATYSWNYISEVGFGLKVRRPTFTKLWRRAAASDWTMRNQFTARSGLPVTQVIPVLMYAICFHEPSAGRSAVMRIMYAAICYLCRPIMYSRGLFSQQISRHEYSTGRAHYVASARSSHAACGDHQKQWRLSLWRTETETEHKERGYET